MASFWSDLVRVMLRNRSSRLTASGRSSLTYRPASASSLVTAAASSGRSADAEVDALSSRPSSPARRRTSAAGVRLVHADQRDGREASREHVVDSTGQHQPAAVDDRHTVARLLDLAEEVARHEHGAPLGTEPREQLADLADAGRVETVDGLVEHEQRGVLQQRRGEAEPLAHAERVLADVVVGPLAPARRGRALRRLAVGRCGRSRRAATRFSRAGHRREQRRASRRSRRPGASPWRARRDRCWPNSAVLPAVADTSPSTQRMVVVLPEPFGPRKPNTPPSGTERSSPSTATVRRLPLRRYSLRRPSFR